MKRMLITGASGYIGKAFIKTFGQRYNLRLFGRNEANGGDEFFKGNIKNLDDVYRASYGIDVILHLAAATTDEKGVSDADYFEINTLGTFNVLESAVKNKVRKVVYGSSVCAVGFRASSQLVRETDRCKPSDGMYGYSKYLSERLCEHYAEKYGINIICLRTAMVVPQHELVISPNPFASHWLGAVHIEDVIEAFRLAVENETIRFDIFHIAADNRCSKFDITRAKNILGYKPKYNFSESTHPGILNSLKAFITFITRRPLRKVKDILTGVHKQE